MSSLTVPDMANGAKDSSISRSRSFHGEGLHRRHTPRCNNGLRTKPALVDNETQGSSKRRKSLPNSLKVAFLDSALTLPVVPDEVEVGDGTGADRPEVSQEEKRLKQQLRTLLKAMLSLRQTDIVLLRQLWSVSDAINEYRSSLYFPDADRCSVSSLAHSDCASSSDLNTTRTSSLSSVQRDSIYSSHDSFEFDESEATPIPIVHLDPS